MLLIPYTTNDWTKSKCFYLHIREISKANVSKNTFARRILYEIQAHNYNKRMLIAQDCVKFRVGIVWRSFLANNSTDFADEVQVKKKVKISFSRWWSFGISNISYWPARVYLGQVYTSAYVRMCAKVTCTFEGGCIKYCMDFTASMKTNGYHPIKDKFMDYNRPSMSYDATGPALLCLALPNEFSFWPATLVTMPLDCNDACRSLRCSSSFHLLSSSLFCKWQGKHKNY